MNLEAAEILANAIEEDIETQKQSRYLEIGEKCDDVHGELLRIEDDIENSIYSLAFRFWDDWGDASNHDWLYHEPVAKEQWPVYAKEIATNLRLRRLPENPDIIEGFMPKPKVSFLQRMKKWLS